MYNQSISLMSFSYERSYTYNLQPPVKPHQKKWKLKILFWKPEQNQQTFLGKSSRSRFRGELDVFQTSTGCDFQRLFWVTCITGLVIETHDLPSRTGPFKIKMASYRKLTNVSKKQSFEANSYCSKKNWRWYSSEETRDRYSKLLSRPL